MTGKTMPTGDGTAEENDVADPHPATEENYDKIPRPGGSSPPKERDPGPNSYKHDGTPPPRKDER